MSRKAAFIHSEQLEQYSYPPDCPFDTNRAAKTRNIINSMGLLEGNDRSEVAPKPADRRVLKKLHSARYLNALRNASRGQFNLDALRMGIGTTDCPVFADLYDYAVLACGGTLTGAELICSGSADVAFNPSGGFHHAGPELASGFCYLNDIALACIVLAEHRKRILYLDVDVHHGDGVADAFYNRSDVMTISLHESGKTLFPGTGFEDEIGTGDGRGHCVNIPLPTGTYDQAYMKAFNSIVLPLVTAFAPDVIVFELGADALAKDPLAHLYLTNNVYADIIHSLMKFDKPILATGGGGYHVENTIRAWALAWSILVGADDTNNTHLGLGGVMLESTDWQGGLRDRELVIGTQQREIVEPIVETVITKIKQLIFPIHGITKNKKAGM